MILNSNRNASPRLQGLRAGTVLTAAAVIAVLVISAAPRLSFGQAAAPTRLPVAASESAGTSAAPPEANITADPAPPLSGSRIAPSGARPKPNPVPAVSSAGTALPGQPPTPPSAPAPSAVLFSDGAIAVASSAAPMVALSGPLETPAPPTIAVRPRRSSEDSIERRLERLERLVETLVARDKNAKLRREDSMQFNYDFKTPAPSGLPGKDKPFKLDHQDLKMMMDLGVSNEEIERIKERALKQAETAFREAHRAAAAANAAAADAIRRSKPVEASDPANVKQQIQALETQRHLLEKELKGIEKQIERMQQEQEKLQQDSTNPKK